MGAVPARIRLAGEGDAADIAAIYAPIVRTSATSFEEVAPTAEEMAARIRGILPEYPWLVCEAGGSIAGYAYASRHRVRSGYQWSVETSVYVDGSRQRQGVGRGLYRSLLRILAAQGFVNAYAGIALPNAGSVALHESLGFEPVGIYRRIGFKLGLWHDTGWWQLALGDYVATPSPPVGMGAMQGRADWPELLAYGEQAIHLAIDGDRGAAAS